MFWANQAFPKQTFTKYYTLSTGGDVSLFLLWQATLVGMDHYYYRYHLCKKISFWNGRGRPLPSPHPKYTSGTTRVGLYYRTADNAPKMRLCRIRWWRRSMADGSNMERMGASLERTIRNAADYLTELDCIQQTVEVECDKIQRRLASTRHQELEVRKAVQLITSKRQRTWNAC